MHPKGPAARAWKRFGLIVAVVAIFTIVWIPICESMMRGFPFIISALFLAPFAMVGVYFYKKRSVKGLIDMIRKMGLPTSLGIGIGYAMWAISSGQYGLILASVIGVGAALWSAAVCILASKELVKRFSPD